MKHSGHGGCSIKREGDFVIKATTGKDSVALLMRDCLAQMFSLSHDSLKPITTADVISFDRTLDEFSFTMPYLDGASIFTHRGEFSWIRRLMVESFTNRQGELRSGFKTITANHVDHLLTSIQDIDLKLMVRDAVYLAISICSDKYPHGFAHGDFGFANLLVNGSDLVAIDFTESFIESPLVDLATMNISLKRTEDQLLPEHFDIAEECIGLFDKHRDQIRAIEKIKFLEWLRYPGSDENKNELIRLICAE